MDTQELLKQIKHLISVPKEWLSLKEAATYAGVSYNTFIKFREMGLPVAEVQGVKRVSRKSIDTFFENHSF